VRKLSQTVVPLDELPPVAPETLRVVHDKEADRGRALTTSSFPTNFLHHCTADATVQVTLTVPQRSFQTADGMPEVAAEVVTEAEAGVQPYAALLDSLTVEDDATSSFLRVTRVGEMARALGIELNDLLVGWEWHSVDANAVADASGCSHGDSGSNSGSSNGGSSNIIGVGVPVRTKRLPLSRGDDGEDGSLVVSTTTSAFLRQVSQERRIPVGGIVEAGGTTIVRMQLQLVFFKMLYAPIRTTFTDFGEYDGRVMVSFQPGSLVLLP
jgi:hypothetical protein